MKIALDISQIVYKGSGVARFTDGLLNQILSTEKKHRYIFYFSSLRNNLDEETEKKIETSIHQIKKYKLPPSFLELYYHNFHNLSDKLNLGYNLPDDLDWFVSSDWIEPKIKNSCKKATIVHDLVFKLFPETVHKKILKTQEKRLNFVSKESDIIFADSLSTKKDLIKIFMIDNKKIFVNYPGINEINNNEESNNKNRTQYVLKKYGIAKPFALSVGKLEPRKNIKKIVDIFSENTDLPELVIVGAKGWGDNNFKEKNRIKTLGFVPDKDLKDLYKNAKFFIYPSLYEGFGYPVVEAMKYHCPVATSNNSSLGEIAKNYAVLFDPKDKDSIKNAIKKINEDQILRYELVEKAYKYSKKFTWNNYYKQFINTLENNL